MNDPFEVKKGYVIPQGVIGRLARKTVNNDLQAQRAIARANMSQWKSSKTVSTRQKVKDIEGRKGSLVRMGPKKTLKPNATDRELVEWVRRERLGIK